MRKLLKLDLAEGQHNPEVPARLRATVMRKPFMRPALRPYLYVLVEQQAGPQLHEVEPECRLLAVVTHDLDTVRVLDRVCPDMRLLAECVHSLLSLRDPAMTAAWEADAEGEGDHASGADLASDEEPCVKWKRRWARRDRRCSYFVEYDGEVKDTTWMEKEVATQQARVAEYDALRPYFEVGEGVVYVMPRPPPSLRDREMLEMDWPFSEDDRADPECRGRYTDAPKPGDHLWLYGVTRRHAGVTSDGFFGGPPKRVEACMVLRTRKPEEAEWMRTELSARREVDGSLTISFWPPVVLWIDPSWGAVDRTLMVRVEVEGASSPVVLLDSYLVSGQSAVRPCKMSCHGAVDEGCHQGAFREDQEHQASVAVLWSANVIADHPTDNYKEEARAVHDMVATLDLPRTVAATTIARAWRRCVACPEYLVCRKRLIREWADLPN
jgi:hypothetical protein